MIYPDVLIELFKGGVLTDGELTISDEGVPRGSPCSTVLANVMAHHVIDCWFENVFSRLLVCA